MAAAEAELPLRTCRECGEDAYQVQPARSPPRNSQPPGSGLTSQR
jgi:hypothetical protein